MMILHQCADRVHSLGWGDACPDCRRYLAREKTYQVRRGTDGGSDGLRAHVDTFSHVRIRGQWPSQLDVRLAGWPWSDQWLYE